VRHIVHASSEKHGTQEYRHTGNTAVSHEKPVALSTLGDGSDSSTRLHSIILSSTKVSNLYAMGFAFLDYFTHKCLTKDGLTKTQMAMRRPEEPDKELVARIILKLARL
jgi:hypothetical protein